jgi:hypothetical protein
MPLESNLYIYGRIIKKSGDTVFVELYKMQPMKEIPSFDMNLICMDKPLVSVWCYDDGFAKNDWKIIGNIPIDKDYKMPDFWTQDSGNDKYYLVLGGDTFEGTFTNIAISEKEAKKLNSYGIDTPISLSKTYVKKLEETRQI